MQRTLDLVDTKESDLAQGFGLKGFWNLSPKVDRPQVENDPNKNFGTSGFWNLKKA